jgi:hypothetical protein
MQAVKPVSLTTPEGVERNLRATPGAMKRMADQFGTSDVMQLGVEKGDWVIFYLAYYMMYDEEGKPPNDLTLNAFIENSSSDDIEEILAAVLAAASQGKTEKNVLAAQIHELVESRTGLNSPPSPPSVSGSPPASSGGDSPLPNSTPEPTGGSESASSPTIAAAS